jgi:hypothetical protein
MTTQTKIKRKPGRPPKKKAPARVKRVHKDDRTEIANMVKELYRTEKQADVATRYVSSQDWDENSAEWKRKRYALAEINGENFNHKGDPLLVRDAEESREDIAESAERAQEQCDYSLSGKDSKYSTTDAEGGSHGLIPME